MAHGVQNGQELSAFAAKSQLEQILEVGLHGAPELKKEEKEYYLGEFRERVIKFLTKEQVRESLVYDEIEQAIQDPRADKVVVHGELPEQATAKYQKLALQYHKLFTVRQDPLFKGNVGLVVAGKDAVDVEQIEVERRADRLAKLGLPEGLIQAAGHPICKACYAKLEQLAPEELKHYSLISPIAKLFGEKCAAHH